MPRRGENIFKRKDGRWEARYIHHYENGHAIYRYLYGKTYSEAKAKRLAELSLPENKSYQIVKANSTFETLAEEWLNIIRNSVKESTYTRYFRIVYCYLFPKFKDYQTIRIDTTLVNATVSYWLLTGGINGKALSAKTVSDILCVLKAIFKYGAENHYPCGNLDTIKFPTVKRSPVHVFSESDLSIAEKQLLDSEDSTKFGFLLVLYTGIRIGELCGLKWGDIDLQNRIVHVRRTVERIADLDPKSPAKTKIVINEPKTDSSFRDIPLTTFLADKIAKIRSQADDNDFMIGNEKNCKEPHWVYLHYKRFLNQCHITDNTFHAMRHTFATRCIEAGFDSKSLSELLGHASITTTLSIYVHPSMELKRKQLERLTPCSILVK